MLSTKFGQDNSGGFRDNAENVKILTDNAGCTNNNEGKKTQIATITRLTHFI